MDSRRDWTVEHYRVWSAWQEQVRKAVRRLWLLHAETRARFVTVYEQLRALPRRVRRALQRGAAQSLAGLALVLALGQGDAWAATINVNAGCTLINAITSANTNSSVGGCTAGGGADTIVLPAASTQMLTAAIASALGDNGLPLITSTITIAGNGSTIARTGGPDFRIAAVDRTGNLTLQNLTLMGGRATGANPNSFAGGVDNSGMLTLMNSTISGNSASFAGGVNNYGTLTLINSTVSGNSASFNTGGVRNDRVLTLTNSTISGNSAADVGGVNNYGTMTLTNSTISGNTADYNAGGVLDFFASLTLTNSTVSGNGATYGGGVYNRTGSATLTNSTVSGNGANSGGGVSNIGSLTLTNSTVSGNTTSGRGGGVSNYGTLTLTRTLVSGNTAPNGSEVDSFFGTVTAADFNLFGHNGLTNAQAFAGFTPSGSDLTATSDGTTPTALSAILNSTLAFNGGPTRTHALVGGSPAIDAVTAGCPPPSSDQRGFGRPVDGNGVGGAQCDSGAFEFAAVLPPVQNPQLTFVVLPATRTTIPNANGCPMGFTHKFVFQARLTNQAGQPALSAIKAVVTTLSSPRLLQNADGGPAGVGATLTVAESGALSDGVLGPTESVDVPFVICLPNLGSFQIKVNVVGVP